MVSTLFSVHNSHLKLSTSFSNYSLYSFLYMTLHSRLKFSHNWLTTIPYTNRLLCNNIKKCWNSQTVSVIVVSPFFCIWHSMVASNLPTTGKQPPPYTNRPHCLFKKNQCSQWPNCVKSFIWVKPAYRSILSAVINILALVLKPVGKLIFGRQTRYVYLLVSPLQKAAKEWT